MCYNQSIVAGKLNKIIVGDGLTEYLELGRGPVVLLLHGWGQSAVGLLSLAERLAKHFRVLVPSLPGAGGSSEPKTAWGVAEYTAWTRQFLAATTRGPLHACLGHSFGGRIMIELFAGVKTSTKLVFIDSAGVKPAPSLKMRLMRAAKVPFRALKKSAKLRRLAVAKFGSTDYQAASPLMREVLKKTVNQDLSGKIPQISAPTLIIWGAEDRETPLSDSEIFAQIKGSRREIIPGAGHFPFLEAKARVNQLIEEFLA